MSFSLKLTLAIFNCFIQMRANFLSSANVCADKLMAHICGFWRPKV